MILSFRCKRTRELFHREGQSRFKAIERPARRKLEMLQAALDLHDLLAPPGNRLEALSGNRAGQHSIRVNDRWRICFRWTASGAEDVEIVDYHD